MPAVDSWLDSWDSTVPTLRPMPEQRSLFQEEPDERPFAAIQSRDNRRGVATGAESDAGNDAYVDPSGQRYLLDCGHHLPGVTETSQRIFWDA